MKYYIGVDGGGTKTAFALFDENKKMGFSNEEGFSNADMSFKDNDFAPEQ